MLLQASAELVSPTKLTLLSGPGIAFVAIAVVVVGGALCTITRRNPVAAVMSLVGTFFGLAATYALLYAHFLAALQVLVYAGAIMVLFIFVVMVLNRDESEPLALRGIFVKLLGTLALAATVSWLGRYLYSDNWTTLVRAHPEPPPDSFGTVDQVGTILFTDYLFAFEAVSVLLLIAVIAAIVVARVHHKTEGEYEPAHEVNTSPLTFGPQGTQGIKSSGERPAESGGHH
jgi:NADH-quinone oxidoreductase subunit J